MKSFVFDVAKCNGCRNCQIVCKDEHCGNSWMPIAAPEPDTGQFWIEVEDVERGSVPKVMVDFVVHMCQHCKDVAPCMKVAADAGMPDAVYRRPDGLVIIDPVKSEGLDLRAACPYDSIFYNEELRISQKCTGCAHLLDDGWEKPRCVEACPHEALMWVDIDELEDVDGLEILPCDGVCEPAMRYRNLPKRFIGGIVVDPEEDEVVVGARVTLQNLSSDEVLVTETDDFGDFWFKQIDPAKYRLYFEADGYLTRTQDADTTAIDRNVNAIYLYRSPIEA